ncbi:V(D)J recombination-activating protein 1-like [Branchiostoma lanceolatum]|uniref:V(D)J recombination-activating protein 1-like n=1 Tax=Branchiostoma lanceolatum TaxID=7740 RepID=UPI00345365E9
MRTGVIYRERRAGFKTVKTASFFDKLSMEEHRQYLKTVCRVCNSRLKKGWSAKVLTFDEVIRQSYGVDVRQDSKELHPEFLCNKCRLKLQRLKEKPKAETGMAIFQPHMTDGNCHCKRRKGRPATSNVSGTTSPATTSPATTSSATTSPATTSQATTSPATTSQATTSPATTSQATTSPATTSPATTSQATTSQATTSQATTSPATTSQATTSPATTSPATTSPATTSQASTSQATTSPATTSQATTSQATTSPATTSQATTSPATTSPATTSPATTSKNQYIREYNILKEKGLSTLCPPKQLDAIEKTLMPGMARYSIEGTDYSENYFHSPVKMTGDLDVPSGESLEPESVTGDFHEHVPDFPCPNTKGVRFPYAHAVAKTLEELDDEIVNGITKLGRDPNDPTLVIHTICKDGADGLGDVSIHKEKADHLLPDKALRFSFCVLKCSIMHNNSEVTIYEDPNPNSVRSNRPILECIGDENDEGTVAICVGPIESQRLLMKDKVMRVHMSDGTQRAHYLTFFNSMIDEKWDRAHGGLAGAGSKYLCTLCEAVREEALEKAGSYEITRTLKKVEVTASKIKYESQEKDTFGVKGFPLLTTEPWERGIDATHADINLGNFFKSLIVREMAQVYSWAKTAGVKKQIADAESKLDKHLKESLGLNPTLMMAGNYAREMFKTEHAEKLVALVERPERRSALTEVLAKFRPLRKVYRANWPLKDRPDEVGQYKARAVEMADAIKTHFPYVSKSCTNYLHKVIEHVQELIEHPSGLGSVGALSSEGNEAGNKLFRQLRVGHARKGNTYNGLRDVLWAHWLYTSKTLRDKAAVTGRSLCCGRCGRLGHNVRTCTLSESSESDENAS